MSYLQPICVQDGRFAKILPVFSFIFSCVKILSYLRHGDEIHRVQLELR